jgi:hypothetical protein
VVIAVDAVGNTVDAHDATLSHVLPRPPEQIELVETARLL